MAYCELQDLIDRFGERELVDAADRDGDGAPDAEVVAAACEDAAAEIDARLARRYRVPFARSTRILRALACDIARHELLNPRPHEEAIRRYEAAVKLLESIASGELSLGDAETLAEADTGLHQKVRFAARQPSFDARDEAAFVGRLR